MARLISRHLGNHIPGNPDARRAEPAGGRPGAGQPHLQQRREGRHRRSRSSSAARRSSPSRATPNARFDPLKMTWLGSVSSYANDAYMLWVNATLRRQDRRRPQDAEQPDRPGRHHRRRRHQRDLHRSSPRTCSASTSRTCAAIAAQPTCSWRSSAARSTARSSGSAPIKVGQTGALRGRRVPAADPVRAHHAAFPTSRCPDRTRAGQGSQGAGAAGLRGGALLHGAAGGRAARPAARPRQGPAGRRSWR